MKNWLPKALELLAASLEAPRHELNELDWKAALSTDKKRLAEHLSAFANLSGGGFLVFGVDNTGTSAGIDEAQIEGIIGQLANLGRDALEPPLRLDHAVATHGAVRLLLVHVLESPVKPVHLRGKSIEQAFIRSGGTTRLASRQEIGALMLNSRTQHWEELRASVLLTDAELIERLHVEPILTMLGRPKPSTDKELLDWMAGEAFIVKEPAGGGFVTNLGAIAAARNLADFPDLARKVARVVVYNGVNKASTKLTREGTKGYAISFQGLMQFVMSLLPQSDVIKEALREKKTVYPEITLREIIANALRRLSMKMGHS